jgi:hypothetical protein
VAILARAPAFTPHPLFALTRIMWATLYWLSFMATTVGLVVAGLVFVVPYIALTFCAARRRAAAQSSSVHLPTSARGASAAFQLRRGGERFGSRRGPAADAAAITTESAHERRHYH